MMKQDSTHTTESRDMEDLYGVSQDTIRALENALEEGKETDVHQLQAPACGRC